jgi:hypothetical protein
MLFFSIYLLSNLLTAQVINSNLNCLNFKSIKKLSVSFEQKPLISRIQRCLDFNFNTFQPARIAVGEEVNYFEVGYDQSNEIVRLTYVDSQSVFSKIIFDITRNDDLMLFKVSIEEDSVVYFPEFVICRTISSGDYFLINYSINCCSSRSSKFQPLTTAQDISAVINLGKNLLGEISFRLSKGRIMAYSIYEFDANDIKENMVFLDYPSIEKVGLIDDLTPLNKLYSKVRGSSGIFILTKPIKNSSVSNKFFWLYGGVHRYR